MASVLVKQTLPFRMFYNVPNSVNIAINGKVKTIIPINSGLPYSPRLIVFFRAKRRVQTIAKKKAELFIREGAYYSCSFFNFFIDVLKSRTFLYGPWTRPSLKSFALSARAASKSRSISFLGLKMILLFLISASNTSPIFKENRRRSLFGIVI